METQTNRRTGFYLFLHETGNLMIKVSGSQNRGSPKIGRKYYASQPQVHVILRPSLMSGCEGSAMDTEKLQLATDKLAADLATWSTTWSKHKISTGQFRAGPMQKQVKFLKVRNGTWHPMCSPSTRR